MLQESGEPPWLRLQTVLKGLSKVLVRRLKVSFIGSHLHSSENPSPFGDDCWSARQNVVVQELRLLVSLAMAASTEECYPKVLPCMAMSSGRILIHYPTVGAEGDLLPLVGITGDRDPVQTLRLVEFVDHIFLLILEVHLREYHYNQRTSFILV